MTNQDGSTGGMSEAAITDAINMVRQRIARSEQQRAELDQIIAVAREEERLLGQLLALRRGEAAPNAESFSVQPVTVSRQLGEAKHPAIQAVIEELTNAGRPIHISDLMRLLRDRSVPIPGSGSQANLISHLRRDGRVVRPSRGMYGLVNWGLQAMAAPRRTRRRRRRIRTTKVED